MTASLTPSSPDGLVRHVAAVLITAGPESRYGCYLISRSGFDYQRLGQKFQQMFMVVLALDLLWAVARFSSPTRSALGAHLPSPPLCSMFRSSERR